MWRTSQKLTGLLQTLLAAGLRGLIWAHYEFLGGLSLVLCFNFRCQYECAREKMTVKITIFRRQFLFGYSYWKNCNGDKKIVKSTKNDSYFNRDGFYRNKARLSVSQILLLWQSFLYEQSRKLFTHSNLHGIKGFVIRTKSFIKIGTTKIFCYNNKMFSSTNKTFGCSSKTFGCSNKKNICCP